MKENLRTGTLQTEERRDETEIVYTERLKSGNIVLFEIQAFDSIDENRI